MPIYQVAEEYSDVAVRRILTVQARSSAQAGKNPHGCKVLDFYYEVEERGEESVEVLKRLDASPHNFLEETGSIMQAMEGVLESLRDRKLLERKLADNLIIQSRLQRARLLSQTLAATA